MPIALLASTAANAEASQIIGTLNGVINQINTQTVQVSNMQGLRNTVVGGDFYTNPFQRGTSFTGITSTLTYTADRFWAVGASGSSISVSQQTTTPPPGFLAHLRFGRADSNADTSVINLGQVFTTANSARYQGQPFVLSFYARSGVGFSSASAALGVTVGTGTGTDESAVLFNSTSWTGYASTQLIGSAGTVATSVTLTSTFQRFALAGVVPVASKQVGFNFSYTPVGTATSDYVELTGIQFEVMPQGGVNPTPFEFRPASLEASLAYYYFYRAAEPQSGAKMFQGQANSTTVASILIPFPVPMRIITTTSLTVSTCSQGTYNITAANGTLATSGLATAGGLTLATGTGTVRGIIATATLSQAALTAAGDTTFLIGQGGSGSISVSAEL